MKSIRTVFLLFLFTGTSYAQEINKVKTPVINGTLTLTKNELKNKIQGGWAGQTIGVTFGGPIEFRF